VWKKDMSVDDAAGIIERFLTDSSLYPQEWNDFVDTPQQNGVVEGYRKRCYQLDPLVNRPGGQDPGALAELRRIVNELQSR
jgi:hypothetical protein